MLQAAYGRVAATGEYVWALTMCAADATCVCVVPSTAVQC